jgi:transcriptional regulator with XRE-family HTH domain
MEDLEKEMEKGKVPIVSIEGRRIKRIREEKKLTQLYVASVVGVTTDTISRWENNRYPTVRRDNAEKLAMALEVDLSEILKAEESAAPATVPPANGKKKVALWALIAIVIVIGVVWIWLRLQHSAIQASRQLPEHAAPGSVIPVVLTVVRETPTQGLIVREKLPDGWSLEKALPGAAGHPVGDEIRWLLPEGSGVTTILYTVKVSDAAIPGTQVAFKGFVITSAGNKARNIAIDGVGGIAVAGIHWSDANGDMKIDDQEIMPAYYLSEQMKDLGVDWPQIEAIWSGHGYTWDQRQRKFIPRP